MTVGSGDAAGIVSPALVLALSVIGVSVVARTAASGWFARRSLSARAATPHVALGVGALVMGAALATLLTAQPWQVFAFGVFVVAAQGVALLLSLRLAEAQRHLDATRAETERAASERGDRPA